MTEKETLMRAIYDHIVLNGAGELAIILDGRYVTLSGRLVYIKAQSDENDVKSLYCYYKTKADDGKWINQDVSGLICQKIYLSLCSSTFYDFSVSGASIPCSFSYINSNVSLGFLILESPLYALGKKLMDYTDLNITTSLGFIELSTQDLRNLKETFRRVSYSCYLDTVYNKVQNRVIQKIYKRNSFYNIQKTFVPVFVSVTGLYNPLFDDKQSDIYQKTSLYQLAVEKNRILEVGDSIKCYMLTHKEICEAFHLSKFMRFTPDFVFKVYVGLLHSEYSEFPNKITKIYVPAVNAENNEGLKSKYSAVEYGEELQRLSNSLEKATDTNTKSVLQNTLNDLMNYIEIDTLRYACIMNKKSLTTIGPSVLDKSVSERDLYNIIVEAAI